jgi:YNFM family putative membrane transporter
VTASVLLASAILAAARWLPRTEGEAETGAGKTGFLSLLSRKELLRIYFVAFSAYFVFSSVFNYLPFYLAGPDFRATTQVITLMYLSYVAGVAVGPLAGNLSDRIGNGATIAAGSALFALAILLTFLPSMIAIPASLAGVCAGFFTVHAAAAGSLNRRLAAGRGRANSLYVLFYYLGGSIGITVSGHAYGHGGWRWVVGIGVLMLCLTFAAGISEMRGGSGRPDAVGAGRG